MFQAGEPAKLIRCGRVYGRGVSCLSAENSFPVPDSVRRRSDVRIDVAGARLSARRPSSTILLVLVVWHPCLIKIYGTDFE